PRPSPAMLYDTPAFGKNYRKREDRFLLDHSLHFDDTLSRFGLDAAMRRAGVVIAAYSGGADSTCMLYHLRQWCAQSGVTLVAAHVNHGIRGGDADRDERFCRDTCESLHIPLYVLRENVPALARQTGRGLEETARDVRYAFFDRVSAELTGCPDHALVATAHNADDNLETVLLHLLRGCGTHGLCGIRPLRDGRYLRPLLCDTGAEIRRWCTDAGVPYVTDATNADTEYTRNFIRHSIVPQMEKICSDPQRAVLRLTELVRRDDEYLEQTAAAYAPDGVVSLPRDTLATLPPAIASRVLLRLYSSAARQKSGNSSAAEEVHVREMLRLVSSDATKAALSLPGGIHFSVDRHTVRFDRPAENRPAPDGTPVFLYPRDGNVFENSRYVLRFSHENHEKNAQIDENIYKFVIRRTFCSDKIQDGFQIRYRRPGDTYTFGGIRRKVKKLFIDRKLTEEEKNSLPLICSLSGEDILWIPLFPPRDKAAVREGESGLTVTFCEKKEPC
ncbi:MAG: tRNA lysidine(34) synthetase TilS, partial [Eubacteriales bacterium]